MMSAASLLLKCAKRLLLLLLHLALMGKIADGKRCANFNHGSAAAVGAGLYDPFICPSDGIAGVSCKQPFGMRNVTDINQSQLHWSDILFYILIGPQNKVDAFLWWLQFINEPVDIVFVADSCQQNDAVISAQSSESQQKHYDHEHHSDVSACSDAASDLKAQVISINPRVHVHISRVRAVDAGYAILSCKLRTGIRAIYDQFGGSKKYFFKIDTDTIVFPRRLMRFINTLDSVALDKEQRALYFGTVVESGGNQLLCRHDTLDGSWRFREYDETGLDLCYAQGGAGYGLNNVAMNEIATSPLCDEGHQSKLPEDLYVALSLYNRPDQPAIIHCGSFRSSELVSEDLFKHSISFHYIDADWIATHGKSLVRHYNGSSLHAGHH